MKLRLNFAGIIPVVLFLLAWEIMPRTGVVDPLFIPPLSETLSTVGHLWRLGDLPTHTLLSLRRALTGFAVAVVIGLPLGLLLGGWFPRVQIALEPLMELFAQANPVVLFHIIILFLGIGEGAKTFIIGWLCLWPVTFSAINGIRATDPSLLKAARSLGLGRVRLFLSVTLPSATPSIFAGLRLSAGYAFIMLIAAEMMGASSGLGWLVIQAQESYDVKRIFAGALLISLLALATDGVLKLFQIRFSKWQVEEESLSGQYRNVEIREERVAGAQHGAPVLGSVVLSAQGGRPTGSPLRDSAMNL